MVDTRIKKRGNDGGREYEEKSATKKNTLSSFYSGTPIVTVASFFLEGDGKSGSY